MARPKTYIIKLSNNERVALQKTIRNKNTCKTDLKRCQILLELDEFHETGLTHALSSLYKAFLASESRRIAKRLDIPYTPKHGSWLDIAEIELNGMTLQSLSRRIEDIDLLRQELVTWESDRNKNAACVHWHFTADNARTKLVSLYPKFVPAVGVKFS